MRKKKLFIIVIAIIVAAFVGYVRTQYVVPILMYHRIDYDVQDSKLSVSPESFARQMEFLSRRGYQVIPLEELIDSIRKDQRLHRRTVVLTFDDGYANNYTDAFPVLLRHGFPATIFIVTDQVGREGYLSWEQVEEMAAKGVGIGSHTLSHPDLADASLEEAGREIFASRRVIAEKLQREVSLFCYPYGSLNQEVKSLVREAGYSGACITRLRREFPHNDVYALPRVRISPTADRLFVFRIKISGYYFWLKEIF